jgi:phosphatidylserine/phosphatidylglycerophosphate/cardiolipin synthase-like enzyme
VKIEKIASNAEYASIGLSCLGTIAAITTQQIAYIAAPLTLSISLSLLNRKRELIKTNRQSTRIEQLIASDTRSTIDRINILEQSLATIPLTLVREITDHSPKYEYELVLDREQSRQALLEALASVKNRLILVCPWLCHHGFDLEIQNQLENLLIKGVTIEIGYGKLSDIEKGKLTGFFYNTLKKATSLAGKYPNLKLKLIGTHEKYLVCDQSFAMLGSHNFLTSGVGEEREIGIKTTDLNLIENLIERYEQAPDRELVYALN